MLKVRTLFSGVGSPEMALKDLQIPFEIIDFCEIDKYAIKSYCAIHGVDESKNLGDISKVWGRNLPYADLLVWGFPCQDISVAGKQKGIQEGETRSGLYHEGFRILKETKPKYSIIENVKNLVGKKFKEDFESMLKDIEGLGYNNYWKVLNAKDYGIPQNRERVFIVSIRKEVDNGRFQFPEAFDNGLRLKDILEDEVDEKYYIPQEKTEKLISQLRNGEITRMNTNPSGKGMNGNVHTGDVSPTITTNKGEGLKIAVKEATKKGYAEATVGDSINIQFPNSTTRRGRVGKGVAQTLETACNQAVVESVERTPLKFLDRNGKKTDGEYSFCVDTAQTGGVKENMSDGGFRIRKLTPKECWRLMGFKDEDFEKAQAAGVSNSQLYKQAGNSIVTNVLFGIFKKLLQAEIAAIYEENKTMA